MFCSIHHELYSMINIHARTPHTHTHIHFIVNHIPMRDIDMKAQPILIESNGRHGLSVNFLSFLTQTISIF
jgi:hypothetical protein